VLGRRLTKCCVKSRKRVSIARSGWNLWKLMELNLRMERKLNGPWLLSYEESRMPSLLLYIRYVFISLLSSLN
jgi:hypothetical protein